METHAPLQRRQQRKACDICRRRKVRCDIVFKPGGPCSVCERSNIECRSTTKWTSPRRGKKQLVVSTDTFNPVGNEQEDDRLGSRIGTASGNRENVASRSKNASTITDSSMKDGAISSHHTSDSLGRIGSAESPRPQDNISPSGVPTPKGENPARSGLARFFRHGINAKAWVVFDTMDLMRIAYVGTSVSHTAHLVELHHSFLRPYGMSVSSASGSAFSDSDPATDASTWTETATARAARAARNGLDDGVSERLLHYPYPPLRPTQPWKPDPSFLGLSSAQDLATDLASFPARDVRDALVAAYFRDIHPFLPIICMRRFLAQYHSPDQPPPLLLFQSILMAGAHTCSHPLVSQDRHAVKSILFRRASMLFHLRHEIDRIHLMQAALLFTLHVGDSDTVSGGPWWWTGVAVRIGCGMGAHRRGDALPLHESAKYRRTWWAAFVSEVFSCLENGRPPSVRAEDIDQVPLCDEDLNDGEPLPSEKAADPATQASFLNRMVELAFIGLDILSASSPSKLQLVDIVDSRLGLWSLRYGISNPDANKDPQTSLLRMHYNLLILHRHRNFSDEGSSRSVCTTAAQAIVGVVEQLSVSGALSKCHFTAVSAITAAGIQFTKDIRDAVVSQTFLVAINALEQLSRLLRCTQELARYWPNAEAVHSVFDELRQEYQAYVSQNLQGGEAAVPDSQPDWNRLLSGIQPTQTGRLGVGQDWMSLLEWNELM